MFCSLLIPLGASHVFTQPGVRLCESQDAKDPRRVLSRLRPGIRAHYVDEKCPAASGHFPAEVLMCFAVRSPDRTSISNRTCSYSGMQSLSVAIRGPPRLSRIFHQTPLPSLLARTRPVSSSVARCLSPHLIPLTATVMLQAGKQALCLSLDCIMYCDCKNMVLDELTEFILHSKVLPPRLRLLPRPSPPWPRFPLAPPARELEIPPCSARSARGCSKRLCRAGGGPTGPHHVGSGA